MLARATIAIAALLSLLGSTNIALGAGVPYLVKEINPTGSAFPFYLEAMGDRLYFNAKDGVHGQELWTSDGTEAGTYMVIDLVPGPDGSEPHELAAVNGKLYFHADNNMDGPDLYVTDGTAAGTMRLADVWQGTDPLPPGQCAFWAFVMEGVGDTVFFPADYPAWGRELWKSNGTPQGTMLVKDINAGMSGSGPAELTSLNGLVLFQACGTGGCGLWKSDGTSAGTVLLRSLNLVGLFSALDRVFFMADQSPFGREPWVSDGTPQGTRLLKDINPGANWSEPSNFALINGAVWFDAFEPSTGYEIWRTDGTEAGTFIVADNPNGDGAGAEFTDINGVAFFLAARSEHGAELWKSDGTPEGTVLVKDIRPGPGHSNPQNLVAVNGKLYFEADDGVHGGELWASDGTEKGTVMMCDCNPGPAGGFYFYPAVANGILFFSSADGPGSELWAVDTRPAKIPTASGIGLLVLGFLLCGVGVVVIMRRTEYGT